jgi:hypothetical protein
MESKSGEREVADVVCSQPWEEVCHAALAGLEGPPAKRPAATVDYLGVYPPGGSERTAMRQCRVCGRWTPPRSARRGICDDCAARAAVEYTDETTHRSTTSSPTAMALVMLERYHVRLRQLRLPAEDETSLRQLIERHNASSRNDIIQKFTNVLPPALIL